MVKFLPIPSPTVTAVKLTYSSTLAGLFGSKISTTVEDLAVNARRFCEYVVAHQQSRSLKRKLNSRNVNKKTYF